MLRFIIFILFVVITDVKAKDKKDSNNLQAGKLLETTMKTIESKPDEKNVKKIDDKKEKGKETIELKHEDFLPFAKALISQKKYDAAENILTIKPYNVLELELERLNLLAEVYKGRGQLDKAEETYRFILDFQPNLSPIRLKLAEIAFMKGNFVSADYHFKLVLTNKNIPDAVRQNINMVRYLIRRNKNWNVWVDFGIAPDTNFNNTSYNKSFYHPIWGYLYLPDPEMVIGFNTAAGLNYEFKLGNSWQIRNELVIQKNTYNKSEYNDLYLGYTVGPKFVYKRGEVFVSLATNKQYFAGKPYSYSIGGRLSNSFDITDKLSNSITFAYSPIYLNESPEDNKKIYSANYMFSYGLNASQYLVFKNRYSWNKYDNPDYNSYNSKSFSIGFGSNLFWGFSAYIEPNITFTNYTKPLLLFSKDNRKDFAYTFNLSLSNNKISFLGFTPNISIGYINNTSNIKQKAYKKPTFEFSINQRL